MVVVDADDGIRPIVLDEITGMCPTARDGLHTFAAQPHPADGTAGAVVTTVDRPREISRGDGGRPAAVIGLLTGRSSA